MKRLSRQQKRYSIIVTRKRNKRRISSKAKHKYSRFISTGNISGTNTNNSYIKIKGPVELGFSNKENRQRLIKWLDKIRSIALNANQKIYINFSGSRHAESLGFIRIISEIDRIQLIKGKKYIQGSVPSNDIALQVFHQIGLAKMIGVKNNHEITDGTVTYWNYISGTKIEADNAGKLIIKLATKYGLSDESSENLALRYSEWVMV